MGCHISHSQCWLSYPDDSTLFCVAVRMGAHFCLWDDFEEILIHSSTHSSSWCQRQIFFTVEKGITRCVELATSNWTLSNKWSDNVWICLSVAFSDPDYKPWYALLTLAVTHSKLEFRIHNVCHCFESLDRNKSLHAINFGIYWNWNILSNVLQKIKHFS